MPISFTGPRRSRVPASALESLLDAAGELDRQRRGASIRRPLLATLAFAGLRLGEALALRWRAVDLAGGRLRIAGAKTDAGVRAVDLLPALRDELATHKARSGGATADDLVFGTSTGSRQNASNVRNRTLAGAVELANAHRERTGLAPLPDGLTPHSLRRTFISLLLAIGEEVPYVMQQVGHVDPKVTLGLYAKVMFRRDGERDRLRSLVGSAAIPDVAEGGVTPEPGPDDVPDAASPESAPLA